MPTTPPSGTAPPDVPNRDYPTGFAAKMDAFLAWMAGFYSYLVAALSNVYSNAVDAYNAAVAAASSAAAALSSQIAAANSASVAASAGGAALWVSGTTYSAGFPVRSPANALVYVRKTPGAGTIDPSADATNWALAAPAALQIVKITGTTGAVSVGQDALFTNAAASAGTAPPSPAIGDEFAFEFGNGKFTNTMDFGSNSITGPNGVSRSGEVTWNVRGRRRLRFYGSSDGGWRVVS